MNKKRKSFFSIGTSSILIIFTLLVLVTFAVLSLVSANADVKLSQSASENITSFYLADHNAQISLQKIDATLAEIYLGSDDENTFYQNIKTHYNGQDEYTLEESDSKLYLSFHTYVTDFEVLNSKLQLTFPRKNTDGFYKILSWNLINTKEWALDEGVSVIHNP